MGKKKKPLKEWQDEQKKEEPQEEKPLTREELMKALLRIKKKRPNIKSSHDK
jgi:hypothetical protein